MRKYWIDMLRGFAIILIVIGHFYQGYDFTNYIYIFHVPLFFVVSGLCYRPFEGKVKDFVIKKVKTLLVPYLCFGIIVVPMAFILAEDYSFIGIIKVIAKYILQRRFTTMWFLTVLFLVEISFYLLEKKFRESQNSQKIIFLFSLVISVIFIAYEYLVNVSLPWNLDLAGVCLIFYSIGYILKTSKAYTDSKLAISILGGVMLVVGIGMGTVSMLVSSERLDVFYGQLGTPVLGIIAAMISCVGLVYIFSNLPQLKILKNIGIHTMTIFALHQMLFKQIFLKLLGFSAWWSILISIIITIAVCILIDIWVGKSKISFVIGKYSKVVPVPPPPNSAFLDQ